MEKELEQIESSQRQHHEVLRHQEVMVEAITGADYKQFALLKPKLYKDGNKWCCLLGENIQEGIVGFGESPYKAVIDWNGAWHRTL